MQEVFISKNRLMKFSVICMVDCSWSTWCWRYLMISWVNPISIVCILSSQVFLSSLDNLSWICMLKLGRMLLILHCHKLFAVSLFVFHGKRGNGICG